VLEWGVGGGYLLVRDALRCYYDFKLAIEMDLARGMR
jgi:hypothetical protein